jgi:hypothetical protein
MEVGNILEWRCSRFPHVVHRWRVLGVYLGGLGQESLIEIESLTHKPGEVPDLSPFGLPTLWVPEPLLRNLMVVNGKGGLDDPYLKGNVAGPCPDCTGCGRIASNDPLVGFKRCRTCKGRGIIGKDPLDVIAEMIGSPPPEPAADRDREPMRD